MMGSTLLALWFLIYALAYFWHNTEIQVLLAVLAFIVGILLLTGK